MYVNTYTSQALIKRVFKRGYQGLRGSGINDKATILTDKAGIVIESGDRIIVNFPGVKFTSTFNMFFFNGLVRKSLPLIR